MKSKQKQPSCKEKVQSMQKNQYEKSYKIQGGSLEVAVMVE